MVDTTSYAGSSQDIYKQLAAFPTYKSGQFAAPDLVRVTTITADSQRNAKRIRANTYALNEGSTATSVSLELPSEVVQSVLSPSGKYLVTLRQSSGGKGRFVEVWTEDTIQASLNVTEVHGAFYTDEYLSSVSFSPSESKIVYVAEGKSEDTETDPFAKYRFVPDLGEAYDGKKRPSVFIFEWKGVASPNVSQITLPDSTGPILLSHPVFCGEDRIITVAHRHTKDHRLFGLIYCPNRQADVLEITLPGVLSEGGGTMMKCDTASQLTPANSVARSPRVLYDKEGRASHLIWLADTVSGAHATCSSLQLRDLTSGNTTTLVEAVWDPAPSEFPGLYYNTLPPSPFIDLGEGSTHIAMTSIWRSRLVVLLISLADGRVENLTPVGEDDVPYSWIVLCTDRNDQILCTRSAPNRPPELVLGRVDKDARIQWRVIYKPRVADEVLVQLERLKTEIIPIPGRAPTETIVLCQPIQLAQPSITFPHGGPHSDNLTVYRPVAAALALAGYVISYPGYTGSVGFGEKHIHELLGKIGTLDIEDCMASTQHIVTLGYTKTGPGQQFLIGGSHGGFISAHLIGQYPDYFSGAILRNPVISLGEPSYSDILDWYFEESGSPYTLGALITPDLYQKLWSMSPISHVDNVSCPVVLMMGEKDRRVATTQGRTYYHALKGRGKNVEMLCFDDDIHALGSVEGSTMLYQVARHLFRS